MLVLNYCIHSFTHIYLFFHSFIYSFTYSFIYSFIPFSPFSEYVVQAGCRWRSVSIQLYFLCFYCLTFHNYLLLFIRYLFLVIIVCFCFCFSSPLHLAIIKQERLIAERLIIAMVTNNISLDHQNNYRQVSNYNWNIIIFCERNNKRPWNAFSMAY